MKKEVEMLLEYEWYGLELILIGILSAIKCGQIKDLYKAILDEDEQEMRKKEVMKNENIDNEHTKEH